MLRTNYAPRKDWAESVESLGFSFHTSKDAYWNEGVAYQFTAAEVDKLEDATNELYRISLEAVDHVVANRRFREFQIPESAENLIVRSWERRDPSLYGRFDLAYDGHGDPKLLEFNADTPTSLLEAAIVQWQWKSVTVPGSDQFNSIHERMVEAWKRAVPENRILHLACYLQNEEDRRTVEYVQDTAIEAGLVTRKIDIADIIWSERDGVFLDSDLTPIQYLFKLYPWEWLLKDEFSQFIPQSSTNFIEPAWKMILSNKAILPLLWELFPEHPNLLPAFRNVRSLSGGDFVEKPILSREGSNVTIYSKGGVVEASEGDYGDNPKIYQARATLPNFDGRNVVIGSWIVGDEAAGMGVREDRSLITNNNSPFAPHIFNE